MNKRTILLGLTILGIICCIELSIVFYQANFNPYAQPSFCNITEFVDCDSVAQTTKSVFLGIPLSYWGLTLYLFILLLLFVDKLKNYKYLSLLKVFKRPYAYISTLGIASFIISVFLAVISIFQIHKICILCFVTYFINLAIGLISTNISDVGLVSNIKTSFSDFIEGVKEYTVPFVIVVILVGVFLTYAIVEMPFVSRKQSIKHYMFMKHNPYKTNGNILGNPNGRIKVHLYSDFKCPVCYSYNIMLHKLVKEYKDILVIHHQFPLDTECNPYLEKQMHKDSCRMARYSIGAENQGNYWGMATLIFELQPKSDEEAIGLAKRLGLDVDRFRDDINSPKTYAKIKSEIETAISLGLDGTPNIIVNNRRCFGAKAYYELKKMILESKN